MVKTFLITFQIIILFSFASYAQNVNAKAKVDSTNYLIGDYINYTITVESPKGVNVFTPVIKDSLKDIDIIKISNPETTENNGKEISTYKYVLAKYDSSYVTVPPIPVKYKNQNDTTLHTVYTNSVSFLVKTLKVDSSKPIKDVKDPIKIPLNWKMILLWAVIIIIVFALLYFVYVKFIRKKRSDESVKKTVKLPPHVAALNKLRNLDEQKLWQSGKIKEYHSNITEIIRRYFEERFNLPALELTTSEAIQLLRSKSGAKEILETTNDFLNNADMVKFAKFTPMTSVNEEMMKQAYDIVNKTKQAATVESSEVNTDA